MFLSRTPRRRPARRSAPGNARAHCLVDRLEPRVLLAGDVDRTFGVQVTTDFGLRGDVALGVARQPDGKLVVVGSSRGDDRTDQDLSLARYNTDGSLDAAFGNGASTVIGKVRLIAGGGRITLSHDETVPDVHRGENGQRVAVQSDGKIVVSGAVDGMITVYRFNPDGSLDTTFDGDGLAAMQDYSFGGTTVFESRTDLALLTDGAGNATGYIVSATQELFTPPELEDEFDQNWVLAKYTLSGQLDPSFGTGGRVVTDFAGAGFDGQTVSWDETFALEVLDDGRIIQAGGNEVMRRSGGFRNAISYARFNPDGSPDTSFGNRRYFRAHDLSMTEGAGVPGRTTIEYLQKVREQGELDTIWTKPFVAVTGLTTGGAGSVLATGFELNRTFRLAPRKNTSRIFVHKLTSAGALDASFAGDGAYEGLPVNGRVNQQDEATSILYRQDIDKILVIGKSGAGDVVRAPGNFLLLQLNPDGTPDTSFGPEGAKLFTAGATMGRFNAALLQPDGKLVAVGESGQGIEPVNSDFVVGRFNPDGSLDTTFGRDNRTVPDLTVLATAVQTDGKILAAGYRGSVAAGTARAVLARYTADGAPDRDFAPVPSDGQGTVGTFANAFNSAAGTPAVAHAVAEGPGGTVYVTGFVGGRLAVARFTPGGAPDTTFDATEDDPATPDVNESDGVRLFDFNAAADRGYGVAVLADGSAVVTGESGGDWLVLKLLPGGNPDQAFGGGDGVALLDRGSAEDAAVTPLVLPDGRILVSGTSRSAADRPVSLVRFNADGSVDPTFAGGAGLPTGLTTGQGVDDPLNRLDARAIAIDPAGNVVVAGAAGNDAAVARFTAAGAPDPAFGNGGLATFHWGGTDDPDSLVFGDGGQIILTGTVSDGANTGPVVAVVNPLGTRRSDFGTNGVLHLDATGGGLARSFRSGELARIALGSRQGNNIVVSSVEQRGVTDQQRRSALQRVLVPAAIAVDPGGPDLTVTVTKPLAGALVGGSKAKSALTITNSGQRPSQPTPVTLYLSADGEVDATDREVATVTVVKPLLPGKTAKAKLNKLVLPSDLPAGTYRVLAKADAANSIVEAGEENNTADGGTITLTPPFTDAVPVSLSNVKVVRGKGTATLLVRNDGNVPLKGNITGNLLVSGEALLQPYTAKATIKPGAMKKIKLRFTSGVMAPFTLFVTADAPGDPTPGQEASAPGVA